jgi:hypothetical protein
MKAFDENSKFIMDEVLDREHVESAKNGMMFLPLEAEKLQKVRTNSSENFQLRLKTLIKLSKRSCIACHKIFICYRSFRTFFFEPC